MLTGKKEFSPARRRFFRGRPRESAASRPPWAVAESLFIDRCTRCGECVGRCPEHVLRMGSGGYPELDFGRGGCTLCGECMDTCEPGALSLAVHPPLPWKAAVAEGCLSMKGVTCRSCGDACDQRAIRFRLMTGGRAEVTVMGEACNGCGACIRFCPVDALRVVRDIQPREVA